MLKVTMATNVFGKIVIFILISYFLWRAIFAGFKLYEGKIGTTKSKQYTKWRLFPSLSICFYKKNVDATSLMADIDGNLQRVLEEDIIKFEHNNYSESG